MSEDNVLRHEIASLDKDLLVASKEIAALQSQLSASQKRERILRYGLESIRDGSSLPVYCAVVAMKRADEVEP